MTRILTLNTGSSSVKFKVFETTSERMTVLAQGAIEGLLSPGVPVTFHVRLHGQKQDVHAASLGERAEHADAVAAMLAWLKENGLPITSIDAAVHRIVHGGAHYHAPVRLDKAVLQTLETLNPLAPLHQVHNLMGARVLQKQAPKLAQYACFDTAFHADHTALFYTVALPDYVREKGVRRYGFHGLSFDWSNRVLKKDFPHLAGKKTVIAHLGNGASLCALSEGKSVDTTMSLTALDGLPMGTRSGALDPGIVLYMQQELGYTPTEITHILYEESGLKGLSGMSNDVKKLSAATEDKAQFALAYYALKVAQYIAMMAVSVGGLEVLVFTGGIGENATTVRDAIIAHLAFMRPFDVQIIPANEEQCMVETVLNTFFHAPENN